MLPLRAGRRDRDGVRVSHLPLVPCGAYPGILCAERKFELASGRNLKRQSTKQPGEIESPAPGHPSTQGCNQRTGARFEPQVGREEAPLLEGNSVARGECTGQRWFVWSRVNHT